MFWSLVPTAIHALLWFHVVAAHDQRPLKLLQSEMLAEPTAPFSFGTPRKLRFKDCGDESYEATIKSFVLSPDPPTLGQQVTVSVSGEAKKPIEMGAEATMSFKIEHVTLFSKQIYLCDEWELENALDTRLRCPTKPGALNMTSTFTIPEGFPSTTYFIKIRAYTVENKPLACGDLEVDAIMPDQS